MESFSTTNEERAKKTWIKPVLDVLDIKDTKHWEFQLDPKNGFYRNVNVEDNLSCYS